LIAGLIEEHLQAHLLSSRCRRSTRWLRRNEEARFYQVLRGIVWVILGL